MKRVWIGVGVLLVIAGAVVWAVSRSESDSGGGMVTHGITPDGAFFQGDPDAPVRFRLFFNFTCSHCREYHETDLPLFIQDFVQTGQAVLEVQALAFGAQPYSDTAAYAALCAGDQDAYWEMQDALLHRAVETPYTELYTLPGVHAVAEDLGLDADALEACVSDQRHADMLQANGDSATDLGVTGVPEMFMRQTGDSGWTNVGRQYAVLANLTRQANTP